MCVCVYKVADREQIPSITSSHVLLSSNQTHEPSHIKRIHQRPVESLSQSTVSLSVCVCVCTCRVTVDVSEWPPRFWKLALEFENGAKLAFSDARRFGRVLFLDNPLTQVCVRVCARAYVSVCVCVFVLCPSHQQGWEYARTTYMSAWTYDVYKCVCVRLCVCTLATHRSQSAS